MHRAAGIVLGASVVFGLTFAPVPPTAGQTPAREQADPLAGLTIKQQEMVVAFQERAKDYSKLRESIEDKMPQLAKESTPEQIDAHKTGFEKRVRAARVGAKHGELFTPDIAAYIRAKIKSEYRGRALKELRAAVLEADTKGVTVRVNYVYPDSKELVEMPPTLLLKLPSLPKQLRYRFVGRNMLLVDRENGLIIDYMLKALP
jgi:hypothetical protein